MVIKRKIGSKIKVPKLIRQIHEEIRSFRSSNGWAQCISDNSWGRGLSIISDHAKHLNWSRKPSECFEVSVDDYKDKSRLARSYRRGIPPKNIVRKVARIYCYEAPCAAVLGLCEKLCAKQGVEFVPGWVFFGVTSIDGNSKSATVKLSLSRLFKVTGHQGALGEYCRFGFPSHSVVEALFESHNYALLLNNLEKNSRCRIDFLGVSREMICPEETLSKRRDKPNWMHKYDGRDVLNYSLFSSFEESASQRGHTFADEMIGNLICKNDSECSTAQRLEQLQDLWPTYINLRRRSPVYSAYFKMDPGRCEDLVIPEEFQAEGINGWIRDPMELIEITMKSGSKSFVNTKLGYEYQKYGDTRLWMI